MRIRNYFRKNNLTRTQQIGFFLFKYNILRVPKYFRKRGIYEQYLFKNCTQIIAAFVYEYTTLFLSLFKYRKSPTPNKNV